METIKQYVYPDTFAQMSYPDRVSRLEYVELYISDRCHLQCLHCFHGDVRSIDHELSCAEWCSVIDQFVDLGVKHFHIAGREPFYDDKSLQVMRYLDQKKSLFKIQYGAITHGLTFKKYLPYIQELNIDYLDFSLDGLQAGHEFLRGKGTFQRTTEAIIMALQNLGSKRVYVSSAVCASNASQIPAMLDWLSQEGVNRFFMQPVQPQGYALGLRAFLISAHDYAKLIDSCAAAMRSTGGARLGQIVFVPSTMIEEVCKYSQVARSALDSFLAGKGAVVDLDNVLIKFSFELQCAAFSRACVITADGYYIGSCEVRSLQNYNDFSVGNVRDYPLRELLYKSTLDRSILWQRTRQSINSLIVNDDTHDLNYAQDAQVI